MLKKRSLETFVLFGYNKNNIEETGYFGGPNTIVTSSLDAMRFYSQNINNVKGFGTPKQWEELINSDSEMNSNFCFHLVKILNQRS